MREPISHDYLATLGFLGIICGLLLPINRPAGLIAIVAWILFALVLIYKYR
jgi:hypothetical protein